MEQVCDGSMKAELSRQLAARRRTNIGFRVVPMIDLFFLLLAFFILTASYKPSDDFLPFVVPRIGGAGASVVEPLVLNIRARSGGCSVHIGQGQGVAVSENEPQMGMMRFGGDLEEVMKKHKRTSADPVEIVCDDAVEWQYVVKVYDVLYGLGINDITFRMTE
jgi:biopolymer transport protein ExbD